jgi:hypothetical protein
MEVARLADTERKHQRERARRESSAPIAVPRTISAEEIDPSLLEEVSEAKAEPAIAAAAVETPAPPPPAAEPEPPEEQPLLLNKRKAAQEATTPAAAAQSETTDDDIDEETAKAAGLLPGEPTSPTSEISGKPGPSADAWADAFQSLDKPDTDG